MNKIINIRLGLSILFFLSISLNISAQSIDEYIPFRKGNKWGYVDKDLNKLIDYKYDDVNRFHPNTKLALIIIDGKKGCIDSTGKEVLAPQFEEIEFHATLRMLKVKKDGLWNLMYPNGRRLLVKWYDGVGWPSNGMIAIRQDRGPEGARIEKWGFADKSKLPKIKAMYDKVGNFDKGLAMVKLGKLYGFINKKGDFVVKPKYINAKTSLDGLSPVSWPDGKDEIKGINFQKWGFVNHKGGLQIHMKYRNVWHFFENRASVVDLYGNAGHIDKNDQIKTPFLYHETRDFMNGMALVRKFDKWGYVDTAGKEIIPVKYIFARPFSEGLAAVKEHSNWGFIDKSDSLIVPAKFYSVQDFKDGLAGFRDKRLRTWGYIDNTGQTIIKPKYQAVAPFKNGIALVKYKGKWGYINKEGKEFWED